MKGGLAILSRNLETGDIITHTDDGGSYSEAYFLNWTDKYWLHCQPTEESMRICNKAGDVTSYKVHPRNVTHLNRQLLSIVPLAGETAL
ncbi:MAG: hypothetical protein MJA28_05810 [Gammaproteobacteria bacterium]|nr:hypothetical protein [Gammaproteobacteria bacterium]